MKVHIYRNLHKNCWSIRHKGKIINHLDELILEGCTFHVQPAGYKRVQKEMRKNVHAYVKGEITAQNVGTIDYNPENRISYNPYKSPDFYRCNINATITECSKLYFNKEGKVYEIN
jgi:hypothetical protein